MTDSAKEPTYEFVSYSLISWNGDVALYMGHARVNGRLAYCLFRASLEAVKDEAFFDELATQTVRQIILEIYESEKDIFRIIDA